MTSLQRQDEAARPIVGKHTLETLTTGMYTNPLDCFREYVQNSVDSIEASSRVERGRMDFRIDPLAKRVVIRDNGDGIPSAVVEATLRNVGQSGKNGRPGRSRGFRGIGRLGGLAYCHTLIFRTRARGEELVSEQEWDCKLLRELLRPNNARELTMSDMIAEVSDTLALEDLSSLEGFFEVEMRNVTEPRLLEVPAVRAHLAAVAPVGFDASEFSHAEEIERHLKRQVADYVHLQLFVNNDAVFKPYADTVPLSRAPGRKRGTATDRVAGIDYVTVKDSEDRILAYAWVGETALKGMIDADSGVQGIRVRSGNIGVGDGHALDACFPKSDVRFSTYLLGEVHVIAEELLPNGRRDGFEHGAVRDEFITSCARLIAEPYRKRIREASQRRGELREVAQAQSVRTEAEELVDRGVATEEEREAFAGRVRECAASIEGLGPGVQSTVDALVEAAADLEAAPRLVDLELYHEYKPAWRDRFQGLFDILYAESADKEWAKKTIEKMIAYLKKSRQESQAD